MFLLYTSSVTAGSSFYGTTGLIKIPTADVAGNGQIVFGAGYLYDYMGALSRQSTVFGTFGLLDRLEIGLRMASRIEGSEIFQKGTTDRMLSIKWVLKQETDYVPAIAVGGHDIIGRSRYFNSLYIVSSKRVPLAFIEDLRLHLGVGTDVWDELDSQDSKQHRFVGIFGGGELYLTQYLALVAEYDAEEINLGARVSIKDIVHVMAGFTDVEHFGCLVNVKLKL